MGCLYCGKEIGAIRQIRDSEFCSAVHRKKYGERLGKVLGQFSRPDPPPAGIAGFLGGFPVQEGRISSTPAAGPTPHAHDVWIANDWPVSVSPTMGGSFRPARHQPSAPVRFALAPASLDLAPPTRMPSFPFSPVEARTLPQLLDCLPTPAPQAAERWLSRSPVRELAAAIPLWLPQIELTAAAEEQTAERVPSPAAFVPAHAPQAAERWISLSAVYEPSAAIPLRLPRIELTAATEEKPAERVPSPADFLPSPAPQAAERWISLSAIKEPSATIPFRQPRIGDLAATNTFIRRIATFASSLEPEPVERDARAVLDSRPAAYNRPLSLLRFSIHAVEEMSAQPAPAIQAPPPAESRPGLRPMPVETMPAVPAHAPAAMAMSPAFQLPTMRAMVAQVLPQARAVEGPAPMPVESMPAARALPGEIEMRPALRLPTLARFQPAEDSAELLASPVPAAGPMPVESMPAVAAFVAKPAPIRPPILAQTFHPMLQARFDMPVVDGPQPSIAVPPAAQHQPAALHPIARIEAQPAGAQPERPAPAIPTPGPFPLEYYCQRITSLPVRRIEALETRVALRLQPFAVPAALGRVGAQNKPSRLVLPFEDLFAKRKPGDKRGRIGINTYGKIAAAVMVGIALWTGSRIANLSRHTEEFRAQVAASERTVAVSESAAVDPTQGNFGKGPLGKIRRAIANRAATEITDTFRAGMTAWGAEKASYAPGWQHNPKGYVTTGAMALFQPSLKYTDYRMEFYGQIEEKSLGWVVRAQDKKNYYAMKFTVIQPGLRPIIAMVHYGVVNGKPGHKVETPLSVMVHNNRPVQVAVDVSGNHFTASIDGERIESWTDDASAQGGVGFFSEPGEKARLYWMKLSRNQDMLGRFCAYLSGGGKSARTAELWFPGFPDDGPGPVSPQIPALALVAAGPFNIRKHRRSEGWIY